MLGAIYSALFQKRHATTGRFTLIAHLGDKDMAPTLNAGWQEMEPDGTFPPTLLILPTRAAMEAEARKFVPHGTPYEVVEVE